MARNPVTLAETLRPWHTAGLFWILGDTAEGERTAGGVAEDLPGLFAAKRAFAAGKGAQAAGASSEAEVLPWGSSRAAPRSPGEEPGEVAPALLPPAWRELLAKTPAAPLLWTYAELGQDLRGQGDRARSAGLRGLIGRLRLPRGSSAFWPLTLEEAWPRCLEAGRLPPDAPFFLQGLARIRPRAVILFGAHSCFLSGLDLSLRLPFTQQVKNGSFFLLLPAWSELVAKRELQEHSLTYLQAAFSSLPGLR